MQFQGIESIEFNRWIINSFSKSIGYNSQKYFWLERPCTSSIRTKSKKIHSRAYFLFYSVQFNKFISFFIVKRLSVMKGFSGQQHFRCILQNVHCEKKNWYLSLMILNFNRKTSRIYCNQNEILIFVWLLPFVASKIFAQYFVDLNTTNCVLVVIKWLATVWSFTFAWCIFFLQLISVFPI